MVGRVLSIGEGLFSGAMLVLGRLCMLSRDADLFHYFMWDCGTNSLEYILRFLALEEEHELESTVDE